MHKFAVVVLSLLVLLPCVVFAVSGQSQADRHASSSRVGGHRCIHNEVNKGLTLGAVPQVLTNSVVHKRQTPTPLRVVFNTDALDSDPDRVCTATGQWVKFGSPGGSAAVHTPACPTGCGDTVSCSDCWFQCDNNDILNATKKTFLLNKVIPDVKSYLSRALNVDGVVGNLVLATTRTTCGCSEGVTIPSSYKTTGVPDADIVIFLSARSTRLQGNTIAFACACLEDGTTHRPIAGHVNWGPNSIDLDTIAYPEQLGVGIHEITHVLGFSEGRYQYFHTGPTGQVLRTITRTATGLAPHNVTVMSTPKVIEEARNHFGCNTLEGLEIEDGGSDGTQGSHWERRVVMTEYMSGYSSYDPVKSRLTLALLEDSGWYYPNYTAADKLYWGAGEGCSFAMDRCTTRQDPYNCDATLQSRDEDCYFDSKRKAKCNIVTFTSAIPDAWYRYYGDPTVGGSDNLADYCGFYRYSKDMQGDCTVQQYGDAASIAKFAFVSYGEVYSPSSRCLRAYNSVGTRGPSCHNMTCVNNQLKVKIGLSWYDCQTANQKIQVSFGFDGYFECPQNPAARCQEVPTYDSWPEFVDINPSSGTVGDKVTIRGSGIQDITNLHVYFGDEHGCSESSMTFNQNNETNTVSIECIIGQRKDAKTLHGSSKVDVVIEDSIGRTATGFKKFQLSSAAAIKALLHNSIPLLAICLLTLFTLF